MEGPIREGNQGMKIAMNSQSSAASCLETMRNSIPGRNFLVLQYAE
jgi:hypothetical protein